ncbi:P-loop NTPase family protein [Streptomyces cacaoi]|uniref:hypothetical protein n=1 Tax=Streptomyces cacaoi TaxID=1898 RepID=UPI0011F39DEA|nr:hypothetical protein [Streptomyces cacaoi]
MQDRYRVVTEPPLSPPSASIEDLERLAAALNAVEDPAAALNDLTADMVALAFSSLSLRKRQKLLDGLGIRMAAPRRVGNALCQDVLSRLRREWRQRACTCRLRELTIVVMNQVGRSVFAQDDETVSDPVTRWGGTLVRATVFAWCSASVADAHILVWAADQDWFAESADDKEAAQLAVVSAAARSIVESNPDFVLGTWDGDEPPLADDREQVRAAVPDRPGMHAPAAEAAVPGPDTPHDVPGSGTAAASDSARTEEGTDPEGACRELESVLAQARQAAEEVTGAVVDGRPPQKADLDALATLDAAFDSVDVVFRTAGIEGVPRRLEDMTHAARRHRAEHERGLKARELLRGLLGVRCAPESPAAAAAEAVRGAADRLLDAPMWDQPQWEESDALTALARLIDLGRQADAATEILALQQQVVRVLPACATAAVMASELTLPQSDEARREHTGREADGTAEAADAGTTVGHRAVQPTEHTEQPAGHVTEETAPEPAEPEAAGPARTANARPDYALEAQTVAPDDSAPASRRDTDGPAPMLSSPAPRDAREETAQVREAAADDSPGETGSEESAVARALAGLIVERRFGLAHHVAAAAGHPGPQVAALRLAGAATLLTSGDSQGARLTADLLQEYGGYAGRGTEGSELLLLPALLRTALITGDHAAGAQLKALAPRLPDRLAEAATAVADRALSGALLIASPLVADVSDTEARLRELGEQSRCLLAPQRLRFARATEIAKRWLAPADGMLGSLLMTVARDDREAMQRVREQAERLSKLAEINNEIDRMDRKHRSPSGKPLQGPVRQDLVHLVERAASLAKEWCLAVDGARRGEGAGGGRAAKEISSLRRSLLEAKAAALGELLQLARSSDAVSAATAWAAHASMEELFALLAGDIRSPSPGGAPDPGLVLDAELLKVCDTGAERPSLDKLLTAVDLSWQDALDERLSHDAFTAARTIVELAGRGLLPGARAGQLLSPAIAGIDDRQAVRRAELREEHRELVAELHRAQADSAVTDDQDLALQELLADAHAHLEGVPGRDLLNVRRALDTVRSDLPTFRQEAADRIRARLDVLDPTADERAQVLRNLEKGHLATASDLVYFLEIGEPVPEIEGSEPHLTEFFPAVPEGLPGGIDREFVDLVRSGARHPALPVLDYGSLSTDEAALTADALDGWRELSVTEPKDRLAVSGRRQLPPLLKLLGYDVKSARPLDERSPNLRRREYRFFEATEVEINGRAKAPAFGSQIREQGGTLRVLMVWGRPPAKVVMSLAERDTSGASLLVVYFGTLSRAARVELAVGSDRLQPLLVVDDAALAYLAARGNRQVSTATQTLLPFSGVNPYIREKRGRIGGEMFYGRDDERRSILDPHGTQVIYGGRGLGKSALLADAGDRFEDRSPGYHQAVYVNLEQENIGKDSSLDPEALWSVLARKLTEARVLDEPQGRRSAKGNSDISERVRAGIRAWTDEDSRRRLLVLLDECDQFFEGDAPRFSQTKKLKGLGDDTKDRAKVVFAGLHSVQRYTKLASNGPFGHLAQTPKVISPLAPQAAADLLVEPMRALGFEFRDTDLVNRVLGYCSYQPFLLQMFGHRLVELMHRKRARRDADGPAYSVELADIETVESDAGLRDSISAAFKDTLSLDHRYDVIANVLAYHARHRGLEVRLSDTELREECEVYWRKGFEQLDTEGFRAYLSEMVGLGILAPNHDGLGWHLRGPNALRMIGTPHEVEARLLRAEVDCELQETIVREARPELSDGRPASLTNTQVDDLLGRSSNQTRVVLGSTATGVGDVAHTLRTLTTGIAGWTLPPVGKPSVYKQALTGGRPRERRVVISDFANYRDPVRPETCREAVDLAETLLPVTPGVTRAVVLVTDPTQPALWRTLLTGTESTSAAPVVLRRHDRRSLHGWAQRVNMFHTEDRLARLQELTGGWPLLVCRAHRLHGELGDPDEALSRLAGLRANRAEARAFAEATGVYSDPLLVTGYRALDAGFEEDTFDLEGAVTAVALRIEDEDEARWIVSCLDALQVFDREDAQQLRLEPLLRACVALHG